MEHAQSPRLRTARFGASPKNPHAPRVLRKPAYAPVGYDAIGNHEMRLRIITAESKAWRWLERFAIVILGGAILLSLAGIVLTRTRPSASRRPAPPPVAPAPLRHEAQPVATLPPEHLPVAPEKESKPSATRPQQLPPLRVPATAAEKAVDRPKAGETRHGIRLRGKGPVVVLAATEADSEELIRHPELLADLIRSGSLFSVPTDTMVEIAGTHDGLSRVLVLEGAYQGRYGWVRAGQVTLK